MNQNKILPLDLTFIILTYNEEKHIERCLHSIKSLAKKIIIIDSYSNDKTIEISNKFDVIIYQNKFINQAKQLNWALENVNIPTQWIFRIDADEFLSDKSIELIAENFNTYSLKVNGFTLNRNLIFLNKLIKYGGLFPHTTTRIWKKNSGKCENSWMDEQVIVDGETKLINADLIDHNIKSLKWHINKHKKYAVREAIEYFLKLKQIKKNNYEHKYVSKKKMLKLKYYYKSPIFLRCIFLFLYVYVFRLGFLDRWQGLFFHVLHSLWFRLLVDLNILKIKTKLKTSNLNFSEIIKSLYGYDV